MIIHLFLFFSISLFLSFNRHRFEKFHQIAPIEANADPVLHTCQTVGRLSNKVARRVYRTVSRQVKMLKKEDVQEYVASLIAVLRLTHYLNFINEKVQTGQPLTGDNNATAKPEHNNHNNHATHQQPQQYQQNNDQNHEKSNDNRF